jgi:hypothetical protein
VRIGVMQASVVLDYFALGCLTGHIVQAIEESKQLTAAENDQLQGREVNES